MVPCLLTSISLQPCVSNMFGLWFLVCLQASVSSPVVRTRLDCGSLFWYKHQSPALWFKHVWIVVPCLSVCTVWGSMRQTKSEYQHFWTVFVPNSKMNNTVKGRERKCWRGNSGTSDYKTRYERALLTSRNLQSERDRVVNVLRKLSNESARGMQYGGQKNRRRDRGPEVEQTQRNKHARESGWELHETWRQLLIGLRFVWRNNAPRIALVFHASLPRGVLYIVNTRRRLQESMIRPDRGLANA